MQTAVSRVMRHRVKVLDKETEFLRHEMCLSIMWLLSLMNCANIIEFIA